MFNSAVPSVADIAAVTDGNNRYGGYGFGEGWWAIIIILALFGGFGRGGLWGNGGSAGCDGACATVGDIERGFNNQSTQQRFNGIDQGLCQLGYDNLAQTTNLQNAYQEWFRWFRFLRNELERRMPYYQFQGTVAENGMEYAYFQCPFSR